MFDSVVKFLDLVRTLLGLSGQLKTAAIERRSRMATLFDKISECLADVSAQIRNGTPPHGRCGELATYAYDLPSHIDAEVGEAKANEIGAILHEARNVEGLAIELLKSNERDADLSVIDEASGKFRALAHMLRA